MRTAWNKGHRKPLSDRLFTRLEVDERGCWLWTGRLNSKGYGWIKVEGREIFVHRILYQVLFGCIPPELELDHLCRVPRCANPFHQEPISHRENVLRGTSPPAIVHQTGCCMRGHPLTAENTGTEKSRPGKRVCRECAKGRTRAYRLRLTLA